MKRTHATVAVRIDGLGNEEITLWLPLYQVRRKEGVVDAVRDQEKLPFISLDCVRIKEFKGL